jgi:hypothetical protein
MNKNKIHITTSNKGGVGKTTITLSLISFLKKNWFDVNNNSKRIEKRFIILDLNVHNSDLWDVFRFGVFPIKDETINEYISEEVLDFPGCKVILKCYTLNEKLMFFNLERIIYPISKNTNDIENDILLINSSYGHLYLSINEIYLIIDYLDKKFQLSKYDTQIVVDTDYHLKYFIDPLFRSEIATNNKLTTTDEKWRYTIPMFASRYIYQKFLYQFFEYTIDNDGKSQFKIKKKNSFELKNFNIIGKKLDEFIPKLKKHIKSLEKFEERNTCFIYFVMDLGHMVNYISINSVEECLNLKDRQIFYIWNSYPYLPASKLLREKILFATSKIHEEKVKMMEYSKSDNNLIKKYWEDILIIVNGLSLYPKLLKEEHNEEISSKAKTKRTELKPGEIAKLYGLFFTKMAEKFSSRFLIKKTGLPKELENNFEYYQNIQKRLYDLKEKINIMPGNFSIIGEKYKKIAGVLSYIRLHACEKIQKGNIKAEEIDNRFEFLFKLLSAQSKDRKKDFYHNMKTDFEYYFNYIIDEI